MLKVSCLSKPLQDNLSQRPAANKGSSMSQLHKVTPDRFAFKFCHLLVLTSPGVIVLLIPRTTSRSILPNRRAKTGMGGGAGSSSCC